MRNQLLNFRPRTTTVELVDICPENVYQTLVLNRRKRESEIYFLPKKQAKKQDNVELRNNLEDMMAGRFIWKLADIEIVGHQILTDEEKKLVDVLVKLNDDSTLTEEESSILWEVPPPESAHTEKYKNQFLQTNLSTKELQKRLFYINQQSKSMLEEQGYNILYMALGSVEWKEINGNNEFRKAPLILIPVELERKKVKGSFKLRWTGEDAVSNISLQAKLIEQGIELPDFEMMETKECVTEYFERVRQELKSKKSWNITDDVYLGFFSFTKFVMFKDLQTESWPEDISLEKSPIIKAIFDPDADLNDEEFHENEVDLKLSPRDVFHVVDADSSQIAVIEDVKLEKNMVVEGPPGTGKSQTIVNLIAELMAHGKTILFVSEKMAALEVVKSRLDHVGLGEFCLELHSRKSNKKDVLLELQSTLNRCQDIKLELDEEFAKLEELRSELNDYVQFIHQPLGEIGFTPFHLFGIKEEVIDHFEEINRKMPRFNFPNPDKLTIEEWNHSIFILNELSQIFKLVRPLEENPWRQCNVDPILPVDLEDIEFLLDKSIQTLDDLRDKVKNLADMTGINSPDTFKHLNDFISTVNLILSLQPIDKNILLDSKWEDSKAEVYALIKDVKHFKQQKEGFLTGFMPDVLDEDLESLVTEYEGLSGRFLKSLSGDYRKIKSKAMSLHIENPPEDDKIMVNNIKNLLMCKKLRDNIRSNEVVGRSFFGSKWQGEHGDPEALMYLSDDILTIRKLLRNGNLGEKSLDILSSPKTRSEISKSIKDISWIKKQFQDLIDKLDEYLHFEEESVLTKNNVAASLKDMRSQLNIYEGEISKLQVWSQYTSIKRDISRTHARHIIEIVEEDRLKPDDIVPCFKGNFADSLLKIAFLSTSILSKFVGGMHENKIHEFKELDNKLISLNRLRIAKKLYESRPSVRGGASPNSELGILLNEFSRKRGHMPIRKLLSSSGSLIQRIKPCFMMSPLSVAQFLDPMSIKSLKFDFVIFDEASQVKPEDALGALLRAEKAVIMGDTKQLPPTSFFDMMIDSGREETYELASIVDMESILHLCKRSFPTKMLRWHYRSRHESLIAVSNHEFYDDNLLIYPSPCRDSEVIGLKLKYLPETVYDRGHSSTNREEAKIVVQTAFEHYKRFGNDRSLGIGTFNVKQQQAILEELELQLKLNPEMEKHFSDSHEEHFFVKNLETIQGDERDVIFISVGYGFDENHRLTNNFGPLNHDGGERRLNVLITRARELCVVFSNFKSRDLKIKPNSPFGLRALKDFLEYADTGYLPDLALEKTKTESSFENSIYRFLKGQGYEVDMQIGCAGFKIDLAVVDPDNPSNYLLGIECDGSMYNSSPVSRDRDRLREEILKRLGWNFHRIWATDWYRNRDESQKNLIKIIESYRNKEELPLRETLDNKKDIDVFEDESKVIVEDKTAEEVVQGNIEDLVPVYEVCTGLGIDISGDLDENNLAQVTRGLGQVVEVESPIHMEEVVRRLRTLWGLKRAGKKIKEVIATSAQLAEQDGQLTIIDGFLFSNGKEVMVRCRRGDIKPKIDLISDLEIEKAIYMVIMNQFATDEDELIKKASRLLGFKSTRGNIAKRLKAVVEKLVREGKLIKNSEGLLDIAKTDT
ncbi:MAG: hypothetical protein CIT01_05110 [Methanobacterium sp. BRmetb2]|jgi:superfamily I DNA and/or RNA helicase|nr:MAG: hypothetical protein CIT01_05110 [Methanobacterium sp. BRmetb2]